MTDAGDVIPAHSSNWWLQPEWRGQDSRGCVWKVGAFTDESRVIEALFVDRSRDQRLNLRFDEPDDARELGQALLAAADALEEARE